MSAPAWCIRVHLKDYEVLTTEGMSEEVARAEFERLQPVLRILHNPTKMVKIGANLMLRQADIERVELVPIDAGEDEE